MSSPLPYTQAPETFSDSEGHKEVVHEVIRPTNPTPVPHQQIDRRRWSDGIQNVGFRPDPKEPHQRFAIWPFVAGIAIGLVVTGAAVGGGMAASLASCHEAERALASIQPSMPPSTPGNSTANSTSTNGTVLFTNYAVAEPQSVNSVFLNCPADNSKTYITNTQYRFTTSCGVSVHNRQLAEGGDIVWDITSSVAYSWQQCADACANHNEVIRNNGVLNADQCWAIVFHSNLKDVIADRGANCWLKNATLAKGETANPDNYAISAFRMN